MVYDNGMLIADNRNLFVWFLGELLLGGGGRLMWGPEELDVL